MNVFCKLNRITFHFFNFTLSLSSRQLAVLLLRCSPIHSICQQHHILPLKQHVRPTLPPFFSYAHISFARCVRPCFITNPRYLNTQLSRFLHKSIPYMTRAYARERKGHNVSTPRPALRENHPPTPFAHSHQRHKSKIWPSAPLSKTNESEKTSEPTARY